MSAPFQPVREDGRPYWRVIYDDIVARISAGSLKVGDVIPHHELSALLDHIPHHQSTLKAAEHLREQHSRNLMSVRGVGYKLVAGKDQAGQALDIQRKSQRSLVRATKVAGTVDHSLLSPADSRQVTQIAKGLAVLAGFAKMTAEKVAQHEQEIQMLREAKMESNARHEATDEVVAELRRRLDELEQTND